MFPRLLVDPLASSPDLPGRQGSQSTGPPPTRSARSSPLVALAVLTALGLALRLSGLDHLLPHRPEMDAHITTQVDAYAAEGGWEPDDPRRVNAYPTLIARIARLAPEPLVPGEHGAPADLAAHIRFAAARHVQVRAIVAVVSALLIPLTFLLAAHFLVPWAALLAAAFIACEPLHLLLGLQARAHGFVPTAMLLAVLAAVHLRRRPTLARYVAAGLTGGIAIGSLHSGLAVLPALLVAYLARERTGRRSVSGPLVAASLLVVAFAWFYADIFAELVHQGLLDEERKAVSQGGHRLTLRMFNFGGFGPLAQILMESNPVLTVTGAAGALVLVLALLRRQTQVRLRSDAVVVAAFFLPYATVLGIYGRTYERFSLPLHVAFALLAAWLVARAVACVPTTWSRPLAATTALLLLAFPAYCTARFAWLRTLPDTCELAARHLDTELGPDEAVILAPGLDLPRFYETDALLRTDGTPRPLRRLWIEHQQTHRDMSRDGRVFRFEPLSYGRSETWHTDYASMLRTLEESPANRLLVPVFGSRLAAERNFLRAAEAWGELEATFSSGDPALDPPAHVTYGFTPHFLPQWLGASALGPELRLYRRKPAQE